MTKKRTPMLLLLSLAVPMLALAQPPHDDGHHDDRDQGRDHGQDMHRAPMPPHPEPHADLRGAGPNHDFRRGGRLPTEYRNRQYVVDDWRGHHLSAPPRGYHWVQTGPDYVLAAIATGIIAQVLLSQ